MKTPFTIGFLLLILFVMTSRSYYNYGNLAEKEVPIIHPMVFELITCWISDTEQPVATEVNLDAVRKNRNEYDHEEIQVKNNLIKFEKPNQEGWVGYELISIENDIYTIQFYHNGGGWHTSKNEISFKLIRRPITISNEARNPLILHVLSID